MDTDIFPSPVFKRFILCCLGSAHSAVLSIKKCTYILLLLNPVYILTVWENASSARMFSPDDSITQILHLLPCLDFTCVTKLSQGFQSDTLLCNLKYIHKYFRSVSSELTHSIAVCGGSCGSHTVVMITFQFPTLNQPLMLRQWLWYYSVNLIYLFFIFYNLWFCCQTCTIE